MCHLQVLDLSYNRLTMIEGLDGLNIEELSLEGNTISDLTGLAQLPRLSSLNVAHNTITSLTPLAAHNKSLLHINLQYNRIAIIRQVECLQSIPWLQVLELAGNPCFAKPLYRERVVFRLPNLGKLDVTMISAEERVSDKCCVKSSFCQHGLLMQCISCSQIRACNLYNSPGGDIDNRTEVFLSVFPISQFVNTGPTLVDDELDMDLEDHVIKSSGDVSSSVRE
jgi:hypothetical protein